MAVRLVLGTLLRMLAYLVGKVPGQALDELSGLLGTLLRPGTLLAARRRAANRRGRAAELRPLFPPSGATVRATVEQVGATSRGRTGTETAAVGRHGAVESGPGGDDADFLEIEQFARLKSVARDPGPVLFLVLLVVSLIACRSLLGARLPGRRRLLPAPADVGDLWARYLDSWHTVGVGSTASAPPYLAVLAVVAAFARLHRARPDPADGLLGAAGRAHRVLRLPPAGPSRLLRAWASVVYAFLPAATGALAGGRLGTAVLAIVAAAHGTRRGRRAGLRLPPGGRPGWRATWAYTLLATFTTAFTPVVWPLTVVLGVALLIARARGGLAQLPGYACAGRTGPHAARRPRPLVAVAAQRPPPACCPRPACPTPPARRARPTCSWN